MIEAGAALGFFAALSHLAGGSRGVRRSDPSVEAPPLTRLAQNAVC